MITATKRLRHIALALLLAAPMAMASEPYRAPTSFVDDALPKRIAQGGLVIARTTPDAQVSIDGKPLRVADDGHYLFAASRDAVTPIALEIRHSDGRIERGEVAIEARDWKIERVDGLPQQTVTPDPERQARITREQGKVRLARELDDPRNDFSQGFIWPAQGRISGVFGSQRILNNTPRSPHMGLDIAAPTGTPVLAPAGAVITLAEDDFFLTGGTLIMDHGHGLSSAFIHLSRIDVAPGERVEQGQVVGAIGATGRATGPHLHWGMNWFNERLDPQLLLPEQP